MRTVSDTLTISLEPLEPSSLGGSPSRKSDLYHIGELLELGATIFTAMQPGKLTD